MLSWFFKKRGTATTPPMPVAPAPKPSAPGPRQPNAVTAKARLVEDAAADWPTQLRAAQGDDAALLRLSQSAAPLAVKLAAVEALTTELALKQAEREFRTHDRKVHRIAKQRLEAAVAQREARATADTLLTRTEALLAEPQLPINHVVALDRDWAALPAPALENSQRERFAALRGRLDAAIHDHGQAQQRLQRWTADAGLVLAEWQSGIAAAAEQGGSADLAALSQSLDALRHTRPEVPATAELDLALARALRTSSLVKSRLEWLEAPQVDGVVPASVPVAAPEAPDAPDVRPEEMPAQLHAQTPEQMADAVAAMQPEAAIEAGLDDPAELPTQAAADTTCDEDAEQMAAVVLSDAPTPSPAQEWEDLPAVDEGALGRLLAQRHALWLAAHRPAVAPVSATPAAAPERRRANRPEPPTEAQLLHINALLQQAEATLAEGRLGDLQQQLSALDGALARLHAAALPDGLRSRHQTLWAEQSRLRDWQRWGGERARDDLADEAEALARQTLAAADPGPPAGPKLNLKLHAEAVQALRQRWKEIDRLGAAASQELWQRFDTALQGAFQPLAAQQAALKAARDDNLLARQALLDTLEALALPGGAPAADDTGQLHQVEAAADGASADWRELVRELERFQLAWRKLGPVEHTVPNRARPALEQRLQSAVARIETPLQDARRGAASAREALIAEAEALLPEPQGQPQGRLSGLPTTDAGRQVRELQALWQEQARGLPLPRGLENALWARFKAATDAVFAQRQAAFAARDDELQANVSAREALLEKLEALDADTSEADIKRTLDEVDLAWRLAGEVPRAASERMEQRLRSAHAAAVQLMGSSARRLWMTRLDTLSARLTLCEAREGGASLDDLAPIGSGLAPLPAPWEQALAQRWASGAQTGPLAESEVDELLLQLETALDLPSAPEWQAARRALKLRALKDSMEGRAAVQGPARHAAWFQSSLRQGGLTPAQRERLRAILTALKQTTPGSLTTAA